MDEEALQILREQIRAEEAHAAELRRQNDLAAASLLKLEQTRQVEARRTRLWLEISERTANLVQQVPELGLLLHGFSEKLDEYGENLREVSKRLDRIEYALMLVLSGKSGDRAKAQALVQNIERDRTNRRLLERHYRFLNELQVQLASYGIQKPVELLIQVEDLQAEIERLEQETESE